MKTVLPIGLWLLAWAGACQGATWLVAAGVEHYQDATIAPLKYADGDAAAVAAAFRASGVPAELVAVLTSDGKGEQQSTRSWLLETLRRTAQRAAEDDQLVFFFAGHGLEVDGQLYLLPADVSKALVRDTSLPVELLNKTLGLAKMRRVVFLIDACRNDPTAGRADADAKLTDGLARGLRPQLAAGAKPPVEASLLACDVGQRAYEDEAAGHGVFTSCLLSGLQGGAAAADGSVSLRRLADYVTSEVTRWGDRHGKPQRPRLVNPGDGDLTLLTKPAEPVVSLAVVNRPLAEVVTLLAHQCLVQVVLGPGVDGRWRVSGNLKALPARRALEVLTLAYGLQVRREGSILYLERMGGAAPEVPAETGDLVVSQDGRGTCATIGEALARARRDDRIVVRPGLYRENVTLRKPVTLCGDGSREGVILWSDKGVTLTLATKGATVQNLTVWQRGGDSRAKSGAFYASAGQHQVVDCALIGGSYASAIIEGADTRVTFERCRLGQTAGTGIEMVNGAAVQLRECQVLRSRTGIGVRAGSTVAVTAERCQFWHCAVAIGLGNASTVRAVDCECSGGFEFVTLRSAGRSEVVGCKVTGLRSSGIDVADASVVVSRCRFEGVSVGGGVVTRGGARAQVDDCRAVDCRALVYQEGGEVAVSDCQATCDNEGYCCIGGQMTLTRCRSSKANWGLYVDGDGRATVRDCHFGPHPATGVYAGPRATLDIDSTRFTGCGQGNWDIRPGAKVTKGPAMRD